jgi:predicted nucleic acid-binding protein
MIAAFADTSYYMALFNENDLRHDKAWSLTDCTSFVVMRQHRLTEALTTDHHFEQAGFKMLLR